MTDEIFPKDVGRRRNKINAKSIFTLLKGQWVIEVEVGRWMVQK